MLIKVKVTLLVVMDSKGSAHSCYKAKNLALSEDFSMVTWLVWLNAKCWKAKCMECCYLPKKVVPIYLPCVFILSSGDSLWLCG